MQVSAFCFRLATAFSFPGATFDSSDGPVRVTARFSTSGHVIYLMVSLWEVAK